MQTREEAGVPQPLPSRAWLVVGLLWLGLLLNYLARTMIATMHGSLVAAFPITEARFGLLSSAFLWPYGLLSPFAGFLSDRFSRSRVIVASLSAWSLVTFLTSFSRTFQELVVMRALMGVCESCYIPAAVALVSDYHRGPTRSRATGLQMTGLIFGGGLNGLGGWLAEIRSWHFSFALIGLIGIGYGALLALILRDAPRESAEEGPAPGPLPKIGFAQALASLLRTRSYFAALGYFGILGICTWDMAAWMPTYLREHFLMTQSKAGFYAGGFVHAAALISLPLTGYWADRWSRTRMRGPMFVTAIMLCGVAPAIFLAVHASVLPWALAGLLLYGFFLAIDSTMMPILCLITDPRYRATAYGLLNMAACLSGGVAVYFTGILRDQRCDLGMILFVSVGCVAFCPLLLLSMVPRRLQAGAPKD